MRLNELKSPKDKVAQCKEFARWAIKYLKIKKTPKIVFSSNLDKVKSRRTFGSTAPSGEIWVHVGNRNSADIMRTLCHELVHHRQFEVGTANEHMDDQQRQSIEDVANALAGRMMRLYGKKHVDIYEWKMSKSQLTEDEFGRSWAKMQRRERELNPDIAFRPPAQLSIQLRRLKQGLMEDHPAIIELRTFQKYLQTLDHRRTVVMAPGSKMSVLQFEPHIQSDVIEIRGFKTPKTIIDVHYKADGEVDWIEFDDGSTFPDKEFLAHNKGGGEYEGLSTLFFPSKKLADQSLMMALLNKPNGWEFGTTNIKEDSSEIVAESRTGSLQHEVADSLPHAFAIPELDSSNPYLQYKFGVAIAGARGKQARTDDNITPFNSENRGLDKDWADNEVIISFDPHVDEIIDQALQSVGLSGKRRIGVAGSKESADVTITSPIKPFKGYPR